MKTKAPGAILVEVIVASGILAFGLTLVYLAFLDATRISQRNELSSNAINYLAGKIDQDGGNLSGITTITNLDSSSLVKFSVNSDIPNQNAKLTKAVNGTCTSGCTVSYKLTWTSPAGDQTLSADKFFVSNGIK